MSRILDTFLALVRIDSPSYQEAACGRHVAELLEDLGLSVEFDGSGPRTGSDIGNLIATLPGTAPGKRLMLSAHLDTVEPGRGIEPVVENGVIRPAGDTILGGDDKCGVAAILEALKRITERGMPHADILVVLTTAEEQGLQGAKALDPSALAGVDLALVLDAGGEPGGIVVGSPTHYTFIAEFEGRGAHAGMEPEKGVSAVTMASQAIAAMRLGRLDEMSTANIGTVTGGIATNVVAASCKVTGECRSLERERVEALKQEMDAAMHQAAAEAGGRVDVRWTKEYDGFLFSPDDPVVTFVGSACVQAGLQAHCFTAGGGSDGNIFTGHGVPTLVLSAGMTDVHSMDETLRVEDLEKLADLIEALLERAVG